MPLVVPNPNVPTNGQSLDATPLLQNLDAVYQAIQNFDASQIEAGTLVASAFNASINPNTLLGDTTSPFVKTGCAWTGSGSSLVGTMSAGVVYGSSATGQIFRASVNAVGSYTFPASKDTYVDVDYNGNLYYQSVSNGAAAPALTANSVRIAKIVTNSSGITSVTQTGFDSLGNLIYPTGAVGGLNLQAIKTQRSNNASNIIENNALVQTGWVGYTFTGSSSQAVVGVTFPVTYTHTLPIVVATSGGDQISGAVAYGNGQNSVQGNIVCKASEIVATGFDIHIYGTAGGWTAGQTVYAQWIAIGA